MEDLINQLKSDYDTLHPIPLESYKKLLAYLKVAKYPKNTVIKHPIIPETTSRYVFSGILGFYESSGESMVCRRIFGPTDTVCDFESYHSGEQSMFCIKAYTDVLLVELTKFNESKILADLHLFAELGVRVNHRIAVRDAAWKKLLWLPPIQRYETLRQLCPLFYKVKVKDIAGMLNLPERTVFRIRKRK